MGATISSGAYILAVIFVAMVALFGLFLLFSRGLNIERNGLVGSFTFITAAMAGIILANVASLGAISMLSLCFLAVSGFAVGRAIDFLLGPREHSEETREGTWGADLAD